MSEDKVKKINNQLLSKLKLKMVVSTVILMICSLVVFYNLNISPQEVYALTADETYEQIIAGNNVLNELNNRNYALPNAYSFLDSQEIEKYDQNPYGTCFAQALAQTINISYEHQNQEHVRVSSLALALQIAGNTFSDGGTISDTIATSYSIKYVSEYDFPYDYGQKYYINATTDYDNVNVDFEQYESCVDVDRYIFFPETEDISSLGTFNKEEYISLMKKYLQNYGSLAIAVKFNLKSINGYWTLDRNYSSGRHAVTIIGYDDDFSKDNFNIPSEKNGAFQVLNSWGNTQDIFYIPYEDIDQLSYIYGVITSTVDNEWKSLNNINTTNYRNVFNSNIGANIANNNSKWVGYKYQSQTNQFLKGFDIFFTSNMCEHGFTTNVDIYLNKNNTDLNSEEFELIGNYNISEGMNKIKLTYPIKIDSSNFSIKLHTQRYIKNDIHSSFLNIDTYIYDGNSWKVVVNNEGLKEIPFLFNVLYDTNENEIDLNTTNNNLQYVNNLSTINYNFNTQDSIQTLNLSIQKYSDVDYGYEKCNITHDNYDEDFNIVLEKESKKISITPKSSALGYYKVIVNVNDTTFTKYITIKDGNEIGFNYIFVDNGKGYSHILTTILRNCNNLTINCYNSGKLRDQLYTTPKKLNLEEIVDLAPDAEIGATSFEENAEGTLVTKARFIVDNYKYNTSRVYTITFNYNTKGIINYSAMVGNATNQNPTSYSKNESIVLEDAVSPTHNFLGWYSDKDYSNQVTNIDTSTLKIHTLYAKWEQKETTLKTNSIKYDYKNEEIIVPLCVDFTSSEYDCFDSIEISKVYVGNRYISYGYYINKLTCNLKIPYKLSYIGDEVEIKFNLILAKQDLRTLGYSFYPTITKLNYAVSGTLVSSQYKVKHWQESLTSEESVLIEGKYYKLIENDTQILSDITGALTNAVAKTYTGFTNKEIIQSEILADNSTEINILYDRKSYSVNLNIGNYIESAYISTDENAVNGYQEGTSFKYGITVYYFVTLPTNTEQYTYGYPNAILINGNSYRVGSVNVTENKTIELAGATRTTNTYSVNLEIGDHVLSAYTDTNENAISGNVSGFKYEYGTTVYYFVTLPINTKQYTYDYPNAVLVGENCYRVGSVIVTENKVISINHCERTLNKYNIKFIMDDLTTIILERTYNYGEYITPPNASKTSADENLYYNFVGWSQNVSSNDYITSFYCVDNAIYIANFNKYNKIVSNNNHFVATTIDDELFINKNDLQDIQNNTLNLILNNISIEFDEQIVNSLKTANKDIIAKAYINDNTNHLDNLTQSVSLNIELTAGDQLLENIQGTAKIIIDCPQKIDYALLKVWNFENGQLREISVEKLDNKQVSFEITSFGEFIIGQEKQEKQENQNSLNKNMIIGVSIVAGLIVLGLAVILIVKKSRKNRYW